MTEQPPGQRRPSDPSVPEGDRDERLVTGEDDLDAARATAPEQDPAGQGEQT